MSNKRQGRVFAVVVMAALGLMAMMASAASAQWLENGASIASNKNVEVGEHTVDGTLDVPSKNLLILCQTIGGSTIKLIAGSLTTAEGSVKFSGCEVLSNEVKQPNCTVDDVTAVGKALLIKHTNGITYVLFEPESGKPFTTVRFLGELCSLPEANNVSGTLVAECIRTSDLAEVDCLTSEKVHGLREALNASTLFPTDGLIYGASSPANILGIATAKLESGNTWAGHL